MPNLLLFSDSFLDIALPDFMPENYLNINYLVQYFSTMKSTGLIIEKVRNANNLSQLELAAKIRVSENYIFNVENLYIKVSKKALKKLTELFCFSDLLLNEFIKGPQILEAAYDLRVSILDLPTNDFDKLNKILPRLYYFLDSFNEPITDDILEPDLLTERKTEISKYDNSNL